MKTTKISGWLVMAAALLVMTMGMAACSSEGDDILGQDSSAQPKETAGVMVTVSAGISDGDGTTRSTVEMDGTKRVLKFTKGDRLYVWKFTDDFEFLISGMLTMAGEPSADGTSAKFTGLVKAYDIEDIKDELENYDFGNNPLENTTAMLIHASMVEGVDYVYESGWLDEKKSSFSNVEELMTKGLMVTGSYENGGYELSSSKSIINCSLSGLEPSTTYRVALQYHNVINDDMTGEGNLITDASGAGTVAFAAIGGTHEWLIKIRQGSTIVGTIDLGERELAAKVYNVTRYWTGSEFVKAEPKEIPLTVQALTAGTIVVNDPREGMQDSLNGGKKTAVTSDAITVSKGDKVQLYGNGTSITKYYGTMIAGGTAQVKVYGNIMSLVDETDYATNTTLTEYNALGCLFYNNANLTDASGLLLPATTLADYCYAQMFNGCTSLTAAPALPAETLASNCYNRMFDGCSSLTAAPALPAETMATSCYNQMFDGCSSLTAAPELPAKTLASSCYYAMFRNCTSLTAAPELPATTLANYCYQEMFYGCTSLTTAPKLPAKTLVKSCYYEMFKGCSSLKSVTCLATNISASNCTENWLKKVASKGTFTKAATMKDWTTGISGIPSKWTQVNAK